MQTAVTAPPLSPDAGVNLPPVVMPLGPGGGGGGGGGGGTTSFTPIVHPAAFATTAMPIFPTQAPTGPATGTATPASTAVPVDPSTLPFCGDLGCSGQMFCSSARPIPTCYCNGTACQPGSSIPVPQGTVTAPRVPTSQPTTPQPTPPVVFPTGGGGGGAPSGGGAGPGYIPPYPPPCPTGTAWDDQTQECVIEQTSQCPAGTFWDPNSSSCLPVMVPPTSGCATGTAWDPTQAACVPSASSGGSSGAGPTITVSPPTPTCPAGYVPDPTGNCVAMAVAVPLFPTPVKWAIGLGLLVTGGLALRKLFF